MGRFKAVAYWVYLGLMVTALLTLIGFWLSSGKGPLFSLDSPSSPPAPASAPVAPAYKRPLLGPTGYPWPERPGYIEGFARHHEDGLSSVTVDNTKNEHDVLVKLYALSETLAYPVRAFFIPRGNSFTAQRVSPGTYDIRFQNLTTGEFLRSEPFTLTEKIEGTGVRHLDVRLTLYPTPTGNTAILPLSQQDF